MTWFKLRLVRAAALVPIFALAASPTVLPSDTFEAPAKAEIEKRVRGSLEKMSTGVEQELLVEGTTARARNASIPLSNGRLMGLASYSPFQPGTSSHDMALRCMTQAIYYEAANEPELGKRAVAQVVLNRMRHTAYPNSICGVVYEGVNARVCQFSFTCDGALLRKPMRRQWLESQDVAKRALAGEQYKDVGTATHYHANYVVPKWAYTLDKVRVIGTHIFYRFPGRGGRPAAFSANWSRSERIPHINLSRIASAIHDDDASDMPVQADIVEGLTVAPHPTDRHAVNDVGGRLDTTKEWRLSIPDPVGTKSTYKAAIAGQSDISAQGKSDLEQHGAKETQE